MRRDAKHGNIIKSIKIILRYPTFAPRLHIRNLNRIKADFANKTAKVRVRIIDLPDDLDHLPVIQTEPGEVLNQLDVSDSRDRPIIRAANSEEQGRLFGFRFYANNNGRTFQPVPYKIPHQFRWILQIRHQQNHRIAFSLHQTIDRRLDMAEVPRVDDYADVRILRGNTPKNRDRLVEGSIIDKQMVVRHVGDGFEYPLRLDIDRLDILFFVIAGSDDRYMLHGRLKTNRRLRIKARPASGINMMPFATYRLTPRLNNSFTPPTLIR